MDDTTRQKLEIRVARLEQQIRAFKELHATELGLILDELARLRTDLGAMAAPAETAAAPAPGATASGTPVPGVPASMPDDPAAASPKRAAWLAEQARKEEERRAPLSRRELLRGRDAEEKS